MTIGNEADARYRELYEKHGGDLELVAAELGLDLDGVEADIPSEPTFVPEARRRPDDLGRESLRRFIVSARHLYEAGWPRADRAALEKARQDYDAGFVEMVQAREDKWIIQYAIPRRKRAKPRAWFTAEDTI